MNTSQKLHWAILGLFSLGLAGCAGLKPTPHEEFSQAEPANPSRGPASEGRFPAAFMNEGGGLEVDLELNKRIAESDEMLSEDVAQIANEPIDIPIEINNRVAAWITYFTQRERERTVRYFERGSAMKAEIERILEQSNVPKELYYLAMIESGFVQGAQSHAKAVGIWQFVPGTATNYGLQINRFVDERLSWIKSTEAAVIYLKDLKNVFGSWYLALAAYNAGEYRIVQAIMRGKTRDFWTLAEGNMLPQETLNYVPKFMAASIIGKNPEKYGIRYQATPGWGEFDVVLAPAGVKVNDLSRVTGIPREEFQRWNPDLLKGLVPYDRGGTFELYLPKNRAIEYGAKQSQIASLSRTQLQATKRSSTVGDYSIYVVRHGDTLSSVARTLGNSIRGLKQLNSLGQSSRVHPGMRLRYLTAKKESSNAGRLHVVKRNETLASIAQKHKVTPEQIVEFNGLPQPRVVEGQRLRVPAIFERSPGSDGAANIHLVRKGDNLSKISAIYGVPVKQLRKLNNLRGNNLIPDQEIRIR